MLILPRDALLTWHMSLKQFTLTAGLLIALAAAENKAQAGTGNGSFATSVTSKTFPREPEHKFCSFIQHYFHRTRCMECDNGEFEPCIAEHLFVQNETCKVRFPLGYTSRGCRAVCIESRVEFKCCKGYWGKECNECPGGSRNPCNGHGRCLVRSGRCICDVGFHGKACELCQNKNKFGPDCSEDCTCEKWECNSGVHADGGCAPENPCNNSISPCGTNSRCLHMTSGIHVCVCDQGYSDMSSDGSGSDTASGGDCVPTDPCQMNNGGCDSTQYCHPLGTAKSQCRCKKGYEPDQRSATCNLRDVCTPEICGHFASCETREPLKYSCVCRGNYTWNGQTCSSNIIEVLGDLSAGDEKFVGTLQYMYNMTSRLYGALLASQGPFTLFVPTDKAFREVFGDTLQELFTDDIHMKEIIRQHIVLGHLITAMPSKRYNLQGYTASLNNTKENNRKVKRYYVQSPDKRTEESVITAGDIVASNGVIHIINSVIRLKDDLPDNAKTAIDVIGHNPQYRMMHSVILMTASSELFSKPNTTVFISDNKAWARLSHGERQYLISDPNGREELRVILKNHVYPGVVDVADLINRKNMESYANIKVKVTIGSSGYIQLGYDGAKLRQADIPFSTGLCHRVDKVLVPSYLEPLMKGRCEFNITRVIKGRCTDCSRRSCSEPGDVLTEHRKLCSVSDFLNHNGVNSSDPQARRSFLLRNFSPKCYAMCYRVIKTSGCCVGFYGLNCLPCPGGARNICSGNGKCDDGENGTGQCACKANFTGFSCELCEGIHNFGPRCDQRCTCQFGTCDNGTAGTGKCQSGTCQQGYSGENCDQKLTPCDSDDACQLNATCYRGSDGNSSCYCAPGFEEDGDNCVRIDFCRRNLCHEQATCSQEAPGVIKCTCNHGWHGDGFMCMPNLPCYNDSSCHEDAICHNTEPGQFRCVCKPGYRGNGTDCDLADPCILNDESCHQQEEEHILEFINYPEIHDDEHSWRSHDQVLSHPVIAGVTAAVVVVLMALFSILIYKKWKRLPWQPSNNLECNFKYSHISTDEN